MFKGNNKITRTTSVSSHEWQKKNLESILSKLIYIVKIRPLKIEKDSFYENAPTMQMRKIFH